MTEVRFRRWSDGVELAVRSFEDYKELYGDGRHYIVSGEHATHTPDGIPLTKRRVRKALPAKKERNENIPAESVPDTENDENSGNEPS
jgi:hypothetical protein